MGDEPNPPRTADALIDRLQQLVVDAAQLNSKLVLVSANVGGGKTALLAEFAKTHDLQIINVGSELSNLLLPIPSSQRSFEVLGVLRDMLSHHRDRGVVVLDNIEVMFDAELKINPFDTIKRLAHAITVVVAWPGNFKDGRLLYGKVGHPEHCDVAVDGAIVLELN